MSLRAVVLQACLHGVLWLAAATGATADDRPPGSVLHLTNGSFVPGELLASKDSKVVRWRSPFFAQPLEFPLGAVKAVHCTAPAQPPKPKGEYCFELVDDDVLYGDLVSLTEDSVAVDAPGIGRLHLRREQVGRFYRWQGAEAIYLGPNGLASWKDSSTSPLWRDEGGQLSTDKPGASLFGDLGLPEKAVIDVELSWKQKPSFAFALGVGERDQPSQSVFQLEVWDNEVVVVGESTRDADLASVLQLGAGGGHICVQAYLDQKLGKLLLLSRSGKSLATLNVDARKAQVRPGVRLTNKKGDVRLERLRITRWNGLPPREVQGEQARVHRSDGSIVYGRLTAYDAGTKQFIVRDGTTETRLKHEEVADLFLSPPAAAGKAATEPPAGAAERTLRVVYLDGSRFSGTVTRVEDEHFLLVCPGVKEPLRLPRSELRALIGLRPGEIPASPAVAGRPGRLEMDGLTMQGRIISSDAPSDASCLVWQPDLSLNASPLALRVSGRIVYRETPPRQPSPPQLRAIPRPQGSIQLSPVVASRRSLHLRSGDTIPCEVLGIDEKGMTFKTPLSDATFVAHEKIKSVELTSTVDSPKLDDPKRGRFLTLPRLQKDLPPTHVICSVNGDFLRGRVLALDEKRLLVEVRLETKEIPRDRVGQIIWLHADELTPAKADAPTAVSVSAANRVQALRTDGNRLTFVVEKADQKTIAGTSDVLKGCRVDLADVDQLLLGAFIEQSAAKLAYGQWKLHHAAEPKFAQADAAASADGRLTGIESPLVGQPAFAFKADTLDGKMFDLADRKGRIVVLEFWATWCGPCLQTMPLVEGVVREFGDRNVELLAVNLEEQPERIKSMLERHKLKVPVALDRDGVVAARYAVTAIPQTVIIDREGKVARLFVGGGKKTAESLRKALQEMSIDKPAPAGSQ